MMRSYPGGSAKILVCYLEWSLGATDAWRDLGETLGGLYEVSTKRLQSLEHLPSVLLHAIALLMQALY